MSRKEKQISKTAAWMFGIQTCKHSRILKSVCDSHTKLWSLTRLMQDNWLESHFRIFIELCFCGVQLNVHANHAQEWWAILLFSRTFMPAFFARVRNLYLNHCSEWNTLIIFRMFFEKDSDNHKQHWVRYQKR